MSIPIPSDAKNTEGNRASRETFLRSPILVALFALVVAGASLALIASPAAANHNGDSIIVNEEAGSGHFDDISSAIAHASAGDTIVVQAGTYQEAPVVESGLDDLTLEADTTDGDVIVDATDASTTIVDIRASDVTLDGFILQWTGDLTDDVTGVRAAGSGADILDVTVELPAEGCRPAADGSDCGPTTAGVRAEAGATIADSVFDAQPSTTEAATWAVRTSTDERVVVDNVEVFGWTVGVSAWGQDTVVRNSNFQAQFTGAQLNEDVARIENNIFQDGNSGVYIAGGDDVTQTDVVLRDNEFQATLYGLLFQDGKTDAVVDAELNYWGLVKEEIIEHSRIGWTNETASERVNEVDIHPYLDAEGNQMPAEPVVECIIDDNGNTTSVGDPTTLQEAVDLTLDPVCQDFDGDGTIERTIYLEPGIEEYGEARIDTQVFIESTDTEGLDESVEATQGALDFGARIHAHSDQPGLHFVDGSQNSHVEGLGIQGEPVGTTAVLAEGISGDSNITLEDVGIGSRNNDATKGIVVRDVDGLSVLSSTILSGDPVVTLENTADTTIDAARIGFRAPLDSSGLDPDATGVLIDDADSLSITNTTILGNAAEASVGIDAIDAADATIANNVIANVVEGITLEASSDATIEANSLAFPALNIFSGDNVAIGTLNGSGHAIDRNTIQGADIGVDIDGTTGVEANLTRINGTTTGVQVAELAEDEHDAEDEIVFTNGTLASTLNALVLTGSTAELDVNAECNDWGVYHRTLIREQRISDGGDNNTVDAQPFTSPNKDSGEVECLVPPKAEFAFEPGSSVTRLDTVDFTDESEEGTYQIREWAWDFDDGNESTEENPSHSYDEVGQFFVELTVHDTVQMSSSKVHAIDVENIPPELQSIPDLTREHNNDMTFQVEVDNVDTQLAEGDELTFDAYQMIDGNRHPIPAGASFEKTGDGTAVFDWDPAPDQYGTYDIQVEVDDGYDTETETTTLTVVNEAPVFDPELPAVEGGVEEEQILLDANAVDPDDGDTIEDLYTDLSELPANASFELDEETWSGTLNWTPGAGEAGTYNVTFVAESPARTTAVEVLLDIREINAPPTIQINGSTVVQDGMVTNLTASADDDEGDAINWSVVTEPEIDGDMLVENDDENEAQWFWDVPAGTSGTYNVTFIADDDYGDPVNATEELTVEARPFIDSLLPRETETDKFTIEPLLGSTVEFAFWAEDADGTLTASDFDVQVGNANGTEDLEPTLEDPNAEEPRKWVVETQMESTGPHFVNVSANDTDGYETWDNTSFQVQPNAPPVVSVDEQVIWANATTPFGTTVNLSGDAQDPEGRQLVESSYEWHLPGSTTLQGPEVNASLPVGTHTVDLEVTDPFGESATETVVVKVDDTVSADGELAASDEGDYYHVDPVGTALEDLTGQATVIDDLGSGVDGAVVTGTVVYYGAEVNDQAVAVGSFENTTDAQGVAEFSFGQDIAGAAGGPSVLSAPGWHEINLEIDAASRNTAPLNDQETASETILYFVGPQVPPNGSVPEAPSQEAGAHADAACYDAPASDDDRNGTHDEARVAVGSNGSPATTAPAPDNVTEGAQVFADQGADCKRGYGQATVFALGTLVQACYDSEIHIQVDDGTCPTSEEGIFATPQLPGASLSEALVADMKAEGACFYEDDGGQDEVQATYGDEEGFASSNPDLEQVQAALSACATGLTNGELPQGGSFVAVTGTAGDEALVVTVNTVSATNAATGEDEPGPTGIQAQGACHYDETGAEDEARVFLGPPAPDSHAPDVANVNEALAACGAAAADGSMPDGGSHARFTATVADSTVAVSADTVPISAATS